MKKILFLGVSALLCWAVAQGIWCKECQSGNTKHCFYKNDVCKSNRGLCYTYVGYLDKEPYSLMYGCISDSLWEQYCNSTERSGRYIHIQTCCNTDKCNGGIPPLPRN